MKFSNKKKIVLRFCVIQNIFFYCRRPSEENFYEKVLGKLQIEMENVQ